jgi:hypothetical protein
VEEEAVVECVAAEPGQDRDEDAVVCQSFVVCGSALLLLLTTDAQQHKPQRPASHVSLTRTQR